MFRRAATLILALGIYACASGPPQHTEINVPDPPAPAVDASLMAMVQHSGSSHQCAMGQEGRGQGHGMGQGHAMGQGHGMREGGCGQGQHNGDGQGAMRQERRGDGEGCQCQQGQGAESTVQAPLMPVPDDLHEGQQIYEQVCSACHSMDPPANLAPPMSHISRHLRSAFATEDEAVNHIRTFVPNPTADASMLPARAQERFGLMPALNMPPEMLEAAARYIWSLSLGENAAN